MNAADYLDWSRVSGLYLNNASRAECYRTYRPLLSPAGLHTVIVAEFLGHVGPVVNVQKWRTRNVYEEEEDARDRISMTADALAAVGAAKAAEAVRAARKISPFDLFRESVGMADATVEQLVKALHLKKGEDVLERAQEHFDRNPSEADVETSKQIEQLLNEYVAAHQTELLNDIKTHGDPREQPGYTREDRLEEIDRQRRKMWAAETQKEQIAELKKLTSSIKKLASSSDAQDRKTQSKLNQLGREMHELIKENRGRPNDHLIPEMKKTLAATRKFMAAYPAAFQPKKLGDKKTTHRLLTIGMYETDSSGGVVDVEWDSPKGFKCDWAALSLSLSYPKKKPELLEPLLDAVDCVRKLLPKRLKEWREQLITNFREVYHPQMNDWELEDYETDAAGEVTDKSIISHVESMEICLSVERKNDEIRGVTSFGVEWDQEHGFEIEW